MKRVVALTTEQMEQIIKCDRCGKRYRGHGDWNIVYHDGYVTGFICPGCQTPEENAEAAFKALTLDYSRRQLDEYGRSWTPEIELASD